jgi:hypothetical protein
MSERYTITDASVGTLLQTLASSGHRVLGPKLVAGRIEIGDIKTFADIVQNGQSVVSAKGVVFPKVERLLKYRFEGKNIALEDAEPQAQATVLFGLRPCEARAFHALDVVFNWDSRDKFFNTRMANTTVVGLTCTQADESCFCTSLGSRPDDTQGSDILLSPLKAGGFVAEVLTEKGKALVALAKDAFQPLTGDVALVPPATVAPAFDAKALQQRLAAKFDSPLRPACASTFKTKPTPGKASACAPGTVVACASSLCTPLATTHATNKASAGASACITSSPTTPSAWARSAAWAAASARAPAPST